MSAEGRCPRPQQQRPMRDVSRIGRCCLYDCRQRPTLPHCVSHAVALLTARRFAPRWRFPPMGDMGTCVGRRALPAAVQQQRPMPDVSRIGRCCLYDCRQRPTLPHSFPCSTIGGIRLNFRVRNGNGCDPDPMTTGKLGWRAGGVRGPSEPATAQCGRFKFGCLGSDDVDRGSRAAR